MQHLGKGCGSNSCPESQRTREENYILLGEQTQSSQGLASLCAGAHVTPEGEADSHALLPSGSGRHMGNLLPSAPLGKEDARNDKILGSTTRKKWPSLHMLSICFCSRWRWRQKHILSVTALIWVLNRASGDKARFY